ncbi:Beta-carotene isomerase D27, chloroplastic [Apostasia shenzhenica]|uniref:Beta-carotene isomerase D27, chloroplastic n=1 Tax=Apostasia shenzhenica TaxID=1088818 RepID=A0A2I0B0U7_9ASPA|nr:Beta-carotene isomerase D27, chloroplastic [Apostasia shenzhenica]
MEAAILLQHGDLASLQSSRRPSWQLPMGRLATSRLQWHQNPSSVVMTVAAGSCRAAAAAPEKTVYVDNWFDRLAIRYMAGVKKLKEGYEGLVEAAAIISGRNGGAEQQQVVMEALSRAFPANLLSVESSLLLSRSIFFYIVTIKKKKSYIQVPEFKYIITQVHIF